MLTTLGILVSTLAGFLKLGKLYTPIMTDLNSAKSELNPTDDERQIITIASARNYNYIVNKSKIDYALQEMQNI